MSGNDKLELSSFGEHALVCAVTGNEPCSEKDWNLVREVFSAMEDGTFIRKAHSSLQPANQ